MKLNICHLYPDVLNLYGDNGNLTCLMQRLKWRGIDCELTRLPIGAKADFTQFDIFVIGGGNEFEQRLLLDDLSSGKAAEIRAAVEDEKVFLCTGGGFQLMGQYFKRGEEQTDFIGALNLHTEATEGRVTGNYMFSRVDDFRHSVVVGYECHSGKTFLGAGLAPLGEVICGFGNNGEDGTEGARYKNVYGSFCHGPLLPKNPEFADSILHAALLRHDKNAVLVPLNDFFEDTAHNYMQERLTAK